MIGTIHRNWTVLWNFGLDHQLIVHSIDFSCTHSILYSRRFNQYSSYGMSRGVPWTTQQWPVKFFFKTKLIYFWILWSYIIFFEITKIYIFRGDLSNISAETATVAMASRGRSSPVGLFEKVHKYNKTSLWYVASQNTVLDNRKRTIFGAASPVLPL